MTIDERLVQFVRRWGAPARFAVKRILPTFVPGRGAVVELVDGWRLTHLLGRGGCDPVFRAERDGTTAALKLLHRGLAAAGPAERQFRQEVLTLARLPSHPNLVGVHDFGFDRGRPAYAKPELRGSRPQGDLGDEQTACRRTQW